MGYAQYKELDSSGVAWLGQKPTHWRIKKLKFATDLINSKVSVEESSLPYLGLEHIESWTGRKIDGEISNSEGLASSFTAGDVLFGKLRPYLAKVHLAQQDGLISSEALVVRNKDELKAEFLRYHMLSRDFINIVDSSTYGSKMPRASWDFIGNLPVLLPDLEEQKTIGHFLDFKTAQIDALIAKKKALLHKLTDKRTALISHAVTKGLDQSVPMKSSGVEWIGDIPRHWSIRRIKFAAKLESGHTPSKQVPEYWEDCDIPWVSLNDSKQLASVDYISETAIQINSLGLANSSARLLPANAVVFTRDATIGLCAITTRPMAVSQHLIAWIPGLDINSLYLLRVFSAMKGFLDSFTFGATIKTIGMPDVKRLTMPIPPKDEQKAITAFIDEQFRTISPQIRTIETAIDKLTEYRSALITGAVTGKIDVRGFETPQPPEGGGA